MKKSFFCSKIFLISLVCFISTFFTIFFIFSQFPHQMTSGSTFDEQLKQSQKREIFFSFEENMIENSDLEGSINQWSSLMGFSANISGTIRPISERQFSYIIDASISNDLTLTFASNLLDKKISINHNLMTTNSYTIPTQYPDVLSIYNYDDTFRHPITLNMSQAIKVSRLKEAMTVSLNEKQIPFSLIYHISTNTYPLNIIETNYKHFKILVHRVKKDSDLTVTIDLKKLSPYAKKSEYKQTFKTFRSGEWLGFSNNGSRVNANFSTTEDIWLLSSTELNLENTNISIMSSPSVSNLSYSVHPNGVKIKGDFRGGQEYKLTVKSKLRDIHKQKLPQKYSQSISMKSTRPKIAQTQNIIILDRDKPIIPFQTVNVTNVKVSYQIIRSDHYMAQSLLGKEIPFSTLITNITITNSTPDTIMWNYFDASELTKNRSLLLHIKFQNADDIDEDTPYTKVILSKSTLTARISSGSLLFKALRNETFEPLEGMRIVIWDTSRGSFQDLGKTTGDGTLHVPLPKLPSQVLANPIFIGIYESEEGDLAYAGIGDTYFTSLDNKHFFSSANLKRGSLFEPRFTSALFTDRSIYKPGEKVQITLISRQNDFDSLDTKGIIFEQNMGITITDPNGVQTTTYKKFNSYGVLNTSFDITNNALGIYQIHIHNKAGQFDTYASFTVSDFTPKDTEIVINHTKSKYLYHENLETSLFAQYLFGGAKTDPVHYQVILSPKGYHSENYQHYTFNSPYTIFRNSMQEIHNFILQDKKVSGKIDIEKRLPIKFPYNADIFIHAVTKNKNGTPITNINQKASVYFPTQLGIQMNKQQQQYHSMEDIPFNLIALDTITDELATNVIAEFTIIKEEPFKLFSFLTRWIPSLTYNKVMLKKKVALGKDRIIFKPKDNGIYKAELSMIQKGTLVTTTIPFVVQKDIIAQKNQLHMSLNKDLYRIGETAVVKIQNPFKKAKALITVEGKTLKHLHINTYTNEIIEYTVPITLDFEPNVHITAHLTSLPAEDSETVGEFRIGTKPINIKQINKQLDIHVSSLKSSYLPGETISLAISTDFKSISGQGEAIVIVRDKATVSANIPNLIDIFYAKNPSYFSTWSSLPLLYIFKELPKYLEEHRPTPLLYAKQRAMADSGISALSMETKNTIDIRSNIAYTAFYESGIPLYSNKKHVISFKLPDNISSFEVTIIVLDKTKFGQKKVQFNVLKPLVVDSIFPKFLRENDLVTWGALVHNTTEQDFVTHISLSNQFTSKIYTNKITANSSKEFTIETKIKNTNTGTWLATVESKKINDGFSQTIPINTYYPKISSSFAGTLDNQTNLSIRLNKKQHYKFIISASPSPLEMLDLKRIVTNDSQYTDHILNKIKAIVGNEKLISQYTGIEIPTLKTEAQHSLNSLLSKKNSVYGSQNEYDKDPLLTIKAMDILITARKNSYDIPMKLYTDLEKNIEKYAYNKFPENYSKKSYAQALALNLLVQLNLISTDKFLSTYPNETSEFNTQMINLSTMHLAGVPLQKIAEYNIQQTSIAMNFDNIEEMTAQHLIELANTALEGRRILNGLPENLQGRFYSYILYTKKFNTAPFKRMSVKIGSKSENLSPTSNRFTYETNNTDKIDINLQTKDKELFYKIILEQDKVTSTNSGYAVKKSIINEMGRKVSSLKKNEVYTVQIEISPSINNNALVEIIDPLYGGIVVNDNDALINNGNIHLFTKTTMISYSITAYISGKWTAPPIMVRQVDSPEVFGLNEQKEIIIK